jgi:ribosome recycling factor
VPPLTEERRRVLVKQAKKEAEESKVAIRNIRRLSNDEAKQLKKDGIAEDEIKKLEDDIQNLTDTYIRKVDKLLEIKERDMMAV